MFGMKTSELKAVIAVQDCTIRLKDMRLKSYARQIESLTRSRDGLAAKVAELTAEVERLRAPAPAELGIVVDGTRTPQRVFIDGHEIRRVMSIKNSNEPDDVSTTTIVLRGPYSVREHAKKSEPIASTETSLPHVPQPLPTWTEWNGGECPVPGGTLVDVRFRYGHQPNGPHPAHNWRWDHRGHDDFDDFDIVAYRIVP